MDRVKRGDRDALGSLFDKYHRSVFQFLVHVSGCPNQAEDGLQEVFLRVLRYAASYQNRFPFRLWLFQIARNQFLRERGKSAEEPLEQEQGPLEPKSMEDPERLLLYRERQARLGLALARLPVRQREALVLSRFGQFKYAEIAEILDCNEGTVKGRVHCALKALKRTLSKREGNDHEFRKTSA